MNPHDISALKALLAPHPDFPIPGILFQDIFPLFKSPSATALIVSHIVHHLSALRVHVVVGLDSRGFLLGPWIAGVLGVGFVPVRKGGKLPGRCHQVL